ncbi:TNT domain-containing protein [Pectinatus frisingensis]|uniref:TNT domain-containing protein n=1 Tax=Pectinatus frisingensis TaxID=865 RepID=UPI0018C8097F|nr:TNT domain-containing protein [Pectinatus frisingensis]
MLVNINWPKNDGFVGTPKDVTLQPGARIDRYGTESGYFVSPEGTPYSQRALAPESESKAYTVYEIVKPIDALGGEIAPWFDQVGGGIQFRFSSTIEKLRAGGYIREVATK